MKKSKKIVIFSALGSVLLGLVIAMAALGSIGFNFYELDSEQYHTYDRYPVEDPYWNVQVEASNGGVLIKPSSNSLNRVVCNISEHINYDVKSENGTLTIKQNDTRKWYEQIGINIMPQYGVIIEVPAGQYEKLSVKTVSGNIEVQNVNFSFQQMELGSISGNIEVNGGTDMELSATTTSGNISCLDAGFVSVEASSTSGDVYLTRSRSDGAVNLSNVSGDLNFHEFDAPRIKGTTISGDVSGTLLSGKKFVVQSVSGGVHVPESDPVESICEIKTTSGDVELRITQPTSP